MRIQTITLSAIAALALPFPSLLGQPVQQEASSTHPGLFTPADIQWKAGPPSLPPGAKVAILEGDPAKEGPFVMRILLPDGYNIPAHTHPKTERVTVISGTFEIAMGDRLERSAAHRLPAGTFGFWPAGMKHTVWAKGETVVQLHGVGPWAINYVNPADDPRNAKK